jgi:hypothetical protein
LRDKTSTTTASAKPKVTADWFKWPYNGVMSNKNDPPNDVDDQYAHWLEYFTTSEIQEITTSTVITSTLATISPRQHYPQMGDLSTRSNWPLIDRVRTVITPPTKRYHSQQNPGVSERNAVQMNGKNDLNREEYIYLN